MSEFLPAETQQSAVGIAEAAALQWAQRRKLTDEQRDRAAAADRIDPVDWILEHFRIPSNEVEDQRLHLGAYQEWVLRRVLTPNAEGHYPYATVVWSDIKKSIKSTIAAAVALYIAWTTEWGQIYVVANDLKQADSRVGYYIRRAIELNPEKFGSVRIRGTRMLFPNGTFIEAIPVDPSGEAGSNADFVVFSELWGALGSSKAHQRMWTEMTLSPMKYGRSIRWVESYAGFTGESLLLEQLYEQTVTNSEPLLDGPADHHWGSDPLPLFHNPQTGTFAMWNTTPRLPWQTPEYYRQQAATLTPSEFQRVHRNQWVTSEEEFVPMEWFDSCGDGVGDPTEIGDQPIVLACDASITGDTTALVGVIVDWDRVAETPPHVRVVIAYRWKPTPSKPMNYEETLIPKILQACEQFRVLQITYDPFQLHQPMMNLRARNEWWVRPFDQGKKRELADKQMRDLIREGRFHWYPELQGTLREHFGNANAKRAGVEENRLRIVKRSPSRHVDLAVATSMAAFEALRIAD